MGRGVYGRCYAREGVALEAVLPTVLALRGKSLFVPMTEHIGVLTDELESFVPPLDGYNPIAVCRSKISVSVNPRFAIAVFVLRLKCLSKQLGPDVRIVVDDEVDEPAEIRDVTALQLASLFALSIIEAPLHLLFWLLRYAL
jgi:hypothetical protein